MDKISQRMFDIGIGELLVLGLVALYVIKPKHFPVLAKLVGKRIYSLKQRLNRIKAEFKAEVQDMNSPKTHD
jgi:sec-independent protein translocase protein TatB